MHNQILNFPSQLSQGVELAKGVKIDKTYEKIIVCGMGASSIAGEILSFWQEVTGLRPAKAGSGHATAGMLPIFYTHRDYDLPPWASNNDLVVCISWSGNTEETLSCYEATFKFDIPVVSITTGGQLAELSNKHKTPLVLIPDKSLAPRMGAGYMTAALFRLVGLGEVILNISLNTHKTEAVTAEVQDENGDTETAGKELSDKIGGATPLLYSAYKWRIIPHLWKILFNENAKIHAFWNYFPTMAHSELAGFTKRPTTNDQRPTTNFYPIFFRDANDDPRQNKNIDTAIAILNKIGYNYSIVNLSSADNPLETVLNSYILGLWATYCLAQKIGVDPEDIKLIEEYKKLKSLSG